MALTKEIVLDKIEIVNDMKDIQIREAVIIKEDGVELSRTNHRRVLESLTGVDNELLISVKKIQVLLVYALPYGHQKLWNLREHILLQSNQNHME
jgi:hypothetical protein